MMGVPVELGNNQLTESWATTYLNVFDSDFPVEEHPLKVPGTLLVTPFSMLSPLSVLPFLLW